MNQDWLKVIREQIQSSIEVKKVLYEHSGTDLVRAVEQLLETLRNGGKILVCGNGGSAADAQHLAAELVVRLKSSNDRPAIPALALTVDTSILTASANDYGFDFVFSRQVEALGNRGDTLIAISTSGNSPNVIEAANMAHEKGLYVIGFLGGTGGKLRKIVDLPLVIPAEDTARIQECHSLLIHIICELIESELFGKIDKSQL